MDYGMIGKIEKARRYAQEPERVTLSALDAQFRGDNSTYHITLKEGSWNCTCPGFQTHHICPHIMTLEKVLRPMLKMQPLPYASGQNMVSDVEKAKRYAEERDRIQFQSLSASFQGTNDSHHVSLNEAAWDCDCDFFKSRSVCCHTMAVERILTGMIAAPAAVGQSVSG